MALGSLLIEFQYMRNSPIGILGQVWYLIVSIPDLCTLTYFKGNGGFGNWHNAVKQLQSMMAFCLIYVLKAVSELDVIITVVVTPFFKYSHEQCQ